MPGLRWTEDELRTYLARVHPPEPAVASQPEPGISESESAFLAKIRQLAKHHGWLCYHTHRSEKSEHGFPDLVLTNGHVVIFAELKNATRKPTKDQAQWLAMLGHVPQVEVYLWRPKDWSLIEARLTQTWQ